MVRKLKTYRTSIGFYDLAIAAPSMKVALEIWGADSNLFHQGSAEQTEDPAVIAATIAHPGIVLRRPVGTEGAFKETSELPKVPAGAKAATTLRKHPPRPAKAVKTDHAAARRAAEAFDRDQQKRQTAQRRDQAAKTKKWERRSTRIAKAQAAIDAAEQEHDARAAAFQAEHDEIQKCSDAGERRWVTRRDKLRDALQRAKKDG